MAIERAAILYLTNGTVVDSGTGIDIRLLTATDPGTGSQDDTTTASATHTQDSQNRAWDPATTGVTANTDVHVTLTKLGYALRLSQDMTPVDDTNCNAMLPAGTITVSVTMTVNRTGSTPVTGTVAPFVKYALYRYNPSTDTGTLINTGVSNGATTWNIAALGDAGTFKAINAVGTNPSAVEFAAGEILYLQVGVAWVNLPNPVTGTTTYEFVLRVNSSNTGVVFGASNFGVRQWCRLSGDVVGEALVSRTNAMALTRDVVGEGLVSRTIAGSLARDAVGEGLVSRALGVGIPRDVVGEGLVSRAGLGTALSRDATGEGLVSRALAVNLSRNVVGEGEVTAAKAVVASKTANIVGEGLVTEVHPVQAFRTFDLVGEGQVTESRAVVASKSFDLAGEGVVDEQKSLALTRDVAGEGEVAATKTVVASKTANIVGEGLITEVHPVQAFRTFDLVGDGEVMTEGSGSSTITLPIDEVPTGGGGTTVIAPTYVFDD